MANNRKLVYAAVAAPTFTLASLASSSTLVAGRESAAVDNTVNLYLDYRYSLKVRAGTTVTAGSAELWVVPCVDGGTAYPDVFDGADSAETVTSRDILTACARLGASVNIDTTNSRDYWLEVSSVASLFGDFLPEKFVFFLTHNTVAALDATAGSFVGNLRALYENLNG